MAFHGGKAVRHWMAGIDLTAAGAVVELSESSEAEAVDVTPLGPLGAIRHEAPIGRVNYTLTEKGFLDDRQASLRRLFGTESPAAPAQPWVSVIGYEDATLGAAVTVAEGIRIRKRSIIPDLEGLATVEMEYYLSEDGDLFEDSRLLWNGAARSHPTKVGVWPTYGSADPAEGRIDDTGANTTTTNSANNWVWMDESKFYWAGYRQFSIAVESANTTYDEAFIPSLQTSGNEITQWNRGSVPGYVKYPPDPSETNETVYRWQALVTRFGPAQYTYDLDGQHAANATEITIDGTTAVKRPQVGDVLQMGTDTSKMYRVDAIEDGSNAGELDLTIHSGLNNQKLDNTVVRYATSIPSSQQSALGANVPVPRIDAGGILAVFKRL